MIACRPASPFDAIRESRWVFSYWMSADQFAFWFSEYRRPMYLCKDLALVSYSWCKASFCIIDRRTAHSYIWCPQFSSESVFAIWWTGNSTRQVFRGGCSSWFALMIVIFFAELCELRLLCHLVVEIISRLGFVHSFSGMRVAPCLCVIFFLCVCVSIWVGGEGLNSVIEIASSMQMCPVLADFAAFSILLLTIQM